MKKIYTYRDTISKDGTLTAHISAAVAAKVKNYCSNQNIASGKFIEDCVTKQLDILEREAYNSMSKEMLVELLLAKKN